MDEYAEIKKIKLGTNFFPPPWDPSEFPEKTEGWFAFQLEMEKNPNCYSTLHYKMISINEMLPACRQRVLVSDEYGEKTQVLWYIGDVHKWQKCVHIRPEEIAFWMPMPFLPRTSRTKDLKICKNYTRDTDGS